MIRKRTCFCTTCKPSTTYVLVFIGINPGMLNDIYRG